MEAWLAAEEARRLALLHQLHQRKQWLAMMGIPSMPYWPPGPPLLGGHHQGLAHAHVQQQHQQHQQHRSVEELAYLKQRRHEYFRRSEASEPSEYSDEYPQHGLPHALQRTQSATQSLPPSLPPMPAALPVAQSAQLIAQPGAHGLPKGAVSEREQRLRLQESQRREKAELRRRRAAELQQRRSVAEEGAAVLEEEAAEEAAERAEEAQQRGKRKQKGKQPVNKRKKRDDAVVSAAKLRKLLLEQQRRTHEDMLKERDADERRVQEGLRKRKLEELKRKKAADEEAAKRREEAAALAQEGEELRRKKQEERMRVLKELEARKRVLLGHLPADGSKDVIQEVARAFRESKAVQEAASRAGVKPNSSASPPGGFMIAAKGGEDGVGDGDGVGNGVGDDNGDDNGIRDGVRDDGVRDDGVRDDGVRDGDDMGDSEVQGEKQKQKQHPPQPTAAQTNVGDAADGSAADGDGQAEGAAIRGDGSADVACSSKALTSPSVGGASPASAGVDGISAARSGVSRFCRAALRPLSSQRLAPRVSTLLGPDLRTVVVRAFGLGQWRVRARAPWPRAETGDARVEEVVRLVVPVSEGTELSRTGKAGLALLKRMRELVLKPLKAEQRRAFSPRRLPFPPALEASWALALCLESLGLLPSGGQVELGSLERLLLPQAEQRLLRVEANNEEAAKPLGALAKLLATAAIGARADADLLEVDVDAKPELAESMLGVRLWGIVAGVWRGAGEQGGAVLEMQKLYAQQCAFGGQQASLLDAVCDASVVLSSPLLFVRKQHLLAMLRQHGPDIYNQPDLLQGVSAVLEDLLSLTPEQQRANRLRLVIVLIVHDALMMLQHEVDGAALELPKPLVRITAAILQPDDTLLREDSKLQRSCIKCFKLLWGMQVEVLEAGPNGARAGKPLFDKVPPLAGFVSAERVRVSKAQGLESGFVATHVRETSSALPLLVADAIAFRYRRALITQPTNKSMVKFLRTTKQPDSSGHVAPSTLNAL